MAEVTSKLRRSISGNVYHVQNDSSEILCERWVKLSEEQTIKMPEQDKLEYFLPNTKFPLKDLRELLAFLANLGVSVCPRCIEKLYGG